MATSHVRLCPETEISIYATWIHHHCHLIHNTDISSWSSLIHVMRIADISLAVDQYQTDISSPLSLNPWNTKLKTLGIFHTTPICFYMFSIRHKEYFFNKFTITITLLSTIFIYIPPGAFNLRTTRCQATLHAIFRIPWFLLHSGLGPPYNLYILISPWSYSLFTPLYPDVLLTA